MNALLIAISVFWVLLVLAMMMIWLLTPVFKAKPTDSALPRVAVIVPFRNEAGHLPDLLRDLDNQSLPSSHFEVWLMDDNSTDNGPLIVRDFIAERPHFRMMAIESGEGKKAAITQAVGQTSYELIMTLDADMRIGPDHLLTAAEFARESGKEFLILPLEIKGESGWLAHFQTIEFDSLMGTTAAFALAGFPVMCNGGNLAFSRGLFTALGGYAGNEHILSGDDIFLLQKCRLAQPDAIAWLHNPAVAAQTLPKPDVLSFLAQRIRWGGKTRLYRDWLPIALATLVLVHNLFLLTGPVWCLWGCLDWGVWGFGFVAKIMVDALFLVQVGRFFGRNQPLGVVLSGLVYPFYIALTAIAGFFYRPRWKGR